MNIKIEYFAILFLVIFGFGFWVARRGTPYSVLLLTVHKLTAVGTGVYLVVTALRQHKIMPLSGGQITSLAVMVVLFVALIATGGFISTEKQMPALVLLMHKYLPYLALASTALSIYLLW